jgi:hypothetical protein
MITVWGLTPIEGALVVSALPLAALAARPLTRELSARRAAAGGAGVLAGGLVALAILPATSEAIAAAALALCGVGLGLAVPALTERAVRADDGLVHDGTVTIGARHAGLVLALALVAPLLSHNLTQGAHNALLGATRVALDGDAAITQKVPIALQLRDILAATPKGKVPDLAKPFDQRGAATNPQLREVRDSLIATLEDAITRSFRWSFLLSATLAALALIPILVARKKAPG